jgi:pimeloyl-ACP methyl ester carboxylesterase
MIQDFLAMRMARPVATPHRRVRVQAADGTSLLVGVLESESATASDVLLFFHGAGGHMGAGYLHLGRDLHARGAAVLLPDLRGHGRSGGERGALDEPARLWNDLDHLVLLALERYPNARLHLGGHSLGASLCLNWMCGGDGSVREGLRRRIASLQLLAPYTGRPEVARAPAPGERPFIAHREDGGVEFGYSDSIAATADLVQGYDYGMFKALATADFVGQLTAVLDRLPAPVTVLAPGADELFDAAALRELLAPVIEHADGRLRVNTQLAGGHLTTLYFASGPLAAAMGLSNATPSVEPI